MIAPGGCVIDLAWPVKGQDSSYAQLQWDGATMQRTSKHPHKPRKKGSIHFQKILIGILSRPGAAPTLILLMVAITLCGVIQRLEAS